MTKMTINLKLVESSKNDFELQWSEDGRVWSKVTPSSPTTTLTSDVELDWNADDSIKKIQIKFKNGSIIPNGAISGNDSKKVKGRCKKRVEYGLSDTYTIKVQPAKGGGMKEYDPIIKTPSPPVFGQ